MFFSPVPRPEGWMVLAWDMQLKVINLLDPLYHKSLGSLPYKDRDQDMAWKLHNALYACLNEFYAGWPSAKENWSLRHEPMSDVQFNATESGVCAIHILRHFDGDKLKLPLTQENVFKTKDTLHEYLKLQGNFSELAHQVL